MQGTIGTPIRQTLDAETGMQTVAYTAQACEIWPRRYADATLGNDAIDGLSPDFAWQTLAKVNGETFLPGDRILFKCGETWTDEWLDIPSSGAAGNHIVFGTYGSGAAPIIDGDGARSNCVRVYLEDYVTLDGLEITNAANRSIYIYTATHVTIKNCTVHDSVASHLIDAETATGCAYLTLDGNTVYNSSSCGVNLHNAESCVVSRNTVYDNGSEGISLSGGDNHSIHHNTVYNSAAANGIVISYSEDSFIYNNLCYNNSVGSTEFAEIGVEVDCLNCKIFNNVLYGSDNSCIITNSTGNEYYHNTLASPDGVAGCMSFGPWGGSYPTANIIRNNIFYIDDADSAAVIFWGADYDPLTNDFDYNLYYYTAGPDKADMVRSSVTDHVDTWTFAEWQSEESQETNGVNDNPDFVTPGTNFHLLVGSPCIEEGATGTGVTDDYDGVTRGDPPDIGAYEYVA